MCRSIELANLIIEEEYECKNKIIAVLFPGCCASIKKRMTFFTISKQTFCISFKRTQDLYPTSK
jgi:hypothetical protein